MSEPEAVKPYLEYLDKEMSIMGILSTFAVAVPSFALSQLLGDNSRLEALWLAEKPTFLTAIGACLLAALAFYRQRSALAYWYGQLAIAIAPGGDKVAARRKPIECIESANSWDTWRMYLAAFWFLYAGLYLFGLAFMELGLGITSPAVLLPAAIAAGAATMSWYFRQRYSDSERPEPPWCTTMRTSLRKTIGIG